MDQSTCTEFVNRIVDSLLKEEIDAFMSVFTPNAELRLPHANCVGLDSIRKAVQGLYRAYENISIDLERVVALEDLALVQWHWRDNSRVSGDLHETESAIVLEFDGAKIKRWREYHAPVLK